MSRFFDAIQGGGDSGIHTPSSPVYNNLNAFTYAGWVRATLNPHGSYDQPLLAKNVNIGPSGAEISWFGTNDPNGLCTFFGAVDGFGSGVRGASFTTSSFPLNVWTHLTMTFDFNGDKKVHLYINGVEALYSSQQTYTNTSYDDSADGFWSGLYGDVVGFPASGDIAELAVWNTVLSPAQIAALAASKTGAGGIASANLVGYWHLCGIANPEPDVSGYRNDATCVNSIPPQGPISPGYSGCPQFITPVLPRGTASLGSPLITPGWPLASVGGGNPLAGAGKPPASQTPDPHDDAATARFQAALGSAGLTNSTVE